MKKAKRHLPVLLTFLLIFSLGVNSLNIPVNAAKGTTFDTIIRGGTILDGSGLDKYDADIGLKDGYIAKIGDLSAETAEEDINAKGQYVSPGFIDIHAHSDIAALKEAKSSLTQGVTTEIMNPDGGGPTDLNERFNLEADGLGINIGSYIGFNSVWKEVMGNEDRKATDQEISDMQELVKKGMEDGAAGVSAGLFYRPAYFADTDEVIDVVRAAKNWRTNFPNHQRNENNEVIEATKETIEIGENAGVAPVITHIKTQGPNNWGKSKEMLQLINDANERGVHTGADIYPYLRSQTGLTAIVPPWVEEGGRSEMLKRFADPELRDIIDKEIEEIMYSRVEGPEGVYFPTKRKTLADYMETGIDEARSRSLLAFLNLNYDHEFDIDVEELNVKGPNGDIVYEYDFNGDNGGGWDDKKFDELHSYPKDALSYTINENTGKVVVDKRMKGNGSAYGKVKPSMPDVKGGETTMRFRVGDVGYNQILRLWVDSDDFASGSSFPVNGYGIALHLNSNELVLRERDNNSNIIHDRIPAEIKENEWFDLKVSIEDDYLAAKIWPASEEEPKEWGMRQDISKEEIIEDQKTLVSMTNADLEKDNTIYFDDLKVESVSGDDIYYDYNFEGNDGDSWDEEKFSEIRSYPADPMGAEYSIKDNTGKVSLGKRSEDFCCSSYGKFTMNMDDVKNSDTFLRFRVDKLGVDQKLNVFTKADKFLSGMSMPVNGYGVELDLKDNNLTLINREDSTTKELETTDANLDTDWHTLRLRADDNEISVRIWKDGEEEPEEWDIVYVEEERELTPGETTMQLLETEGSLRTIYDFGREDDFERFLQSPVVAIASDGGSTTSDSVHPRRYGTQPRALGKFVREDGLISWEEAIVKMTSLPATMIGLSDRGYIAEGMKADITIFDPDTTIDHATFEDPKQYAEGIKHVFINGQLVLTDGELTGVQAGEAIRVEPNMPTRPMTMSEDINISDSRSLVTLEGSENDGKASIVYELDQGAKDVKAEGSLKIVDENNSINLESNDFGRIQVFDGWKSLTGTGTLNGNALTTFRITIDENDPTIDDERAVITIDIVGEEQIKALLDKEIPGEVDKTLLENKVEEIMGADLDEADFTEESWRALEKTLSSAETILEDEEATQAEVNEALAKLETAFENLEEKTSGDLSIDEMKALIDRFVEEKEISNDDAARKLKTHLTAIGHYEDKGDKKKAIKHMEGFKKLIIQQKEEELISKKVFTTLTKYADNLIEQWR